MGVRYVDTDRLKFQKVPCDFDQIMLLELAYAIKDPSVNLKFLPVIDSYETVIRNADFLLAAKKARMPHMLVEDLSLQHDKFELEGIIDVNYIFFNSRNSKKRDFNEPGYDHYLQELAKYLHLNCMGEVGELWYTKKVHPKTRKDILKYTIYGNIGNRVCLRFPTKMVLQKINHDKPIDSVNGIPYEEFVRRG